MTCSARSRRRSGFWPLLAALSLLAVGAQATEPLPRSDVPGPLVPWIDWALRGSEDRACPFAHGSGEPRCEWPSSLRLELAPGGATFRQRVHTDRPGWLRLPGAAKTWPDAVKRGGAAAAVIERGGAPVTFVPAGDHVVEGRFVWPKLPPLLTVPPETALVELILDGRSVERPNRDRPDRLWLGAAPPRRLRAGVSLPVPPVPLDSPAPVLAAAAARFGR